MADWLITGTGGMLGRDLFDRLTAEGADVAGLGRADLDITDPSAVRRVLDHHRPAVVVNCAAYTAVDRAESEEAAALRVNGQGAAYLAAACAALPGTRLVHVSTDYVFAGTASEPYPEDGEPAPRSAYGRTKLAGERAVLGALPDRAIIARTAWLYGAHGANFVRTMIRLAGERDTVDVVTSQRGQPTWTGDLAAHLILLGRAERAAGVYHVTSSGEATWFDLAQEVFRLLGADPSRVRAVRDMPRPAARPAYSVLGHDRLRAAGMPPMRDWRAALAAAFPSFT